MSAIHDLFFGELDPQEHHRNPPPHVVALMEELDTLEAALLSRLKDEDKFALLRLIDAYSELLANTDVSAFETGFKIGARLLAEAFVHREETSHKLKVEAILLAGEKKQ